MQVPIWQAIFVEEPPSWNAHSLSGRTALTAGMGSDSASLLRTRSPDSREYSRRQPETVFATELRKQYTILIEKRGAWLECSIRKFSSLMMTRSRENL